MQQHSFVRKHAAIACTLSLALATSPFATAFAAGNDSATPIAGLAEINAQVEATTTAYREAEAELENLNAQIADNEAKVLSKRCGIESSEAKIIVDTARVIRNLHTKGELSSTLSTRETLGAGRMVADGWSVLEAMERCFLPFYEGSKTEGERSVVYKTFLRH